ncbi:HAMP domain-containing histidine kinase, partial [Leptolyngbya sp. FACHB-36]|uniref:sensor histidine kinase n=1 Tax=Leptolyngbya sp. FACHB-36 TaxID=2692808 RepID=UPI0016808431
VQIDPQTYHLLDSDALNIAHWQIRGVETQVRYERAQAQMIQSDKMANLGRLVDGIAHEILDPVSFIWGNLSHVADYGASLLKLLEAYENALPEPPSELRHLYQDLEIDYLREDLSRTIVSIQTGAERLSKLAISLQNFCHIDTVYPKPADLHELLDGILLLLKSRLSSEIQVIKHYGRLPPVPCFAGQLNQVFMNILSNAVDVLLDQAVSQQFEDPTVSQRRSKPTIEVTTQVRSLSDHSGKATRWVSICIANNGPGLPPQAKQQILESFSIKKRALKETSLAVSYQIITAKHGGKFEVRSSMCDESLSCETCTIETGTEFEILLPLL